MLWMSADTFVSRRTLPSTASVKNGEDDARDRAPAAEDVDAAEQHDRDDVERQAAADVGSGAGEAGGEDDAGERRDGPGQHEQPAA